MRARLPDRARGCSANSTIRSRRCRGCAAERGGFGLLPELGYAPVNRYLPPRQPQPVLGEDDPRALLERGLASLASPVIRR